MLRKQFKPNIGNAPTYFILLALLPIFIGVFSCSKGGPPGKIIDEAKMRSEAIIDSVRQVSETVTGEAELVDEYYDEQEKRYVIKYFVETEFGATHPDNPTAYITKEDKRWKYEFDYGRKYTSYLGVTQ